jgi:hypothetical protein
MRMIKLLAVVTIMGLSQPAFSQSDEDIMQMSIAELEANRTELVSSSMRMDASTAEKVWPVYQAYRTDIGSHKQSMLDLIKRYAENYGALTDDQAATLIKDYMKLESDRLKIRKKYVKKMQQTVGDVLAMRFLQIENKMDSIVGFGIGAQIPLAE